MKRVSPASICIHIHQKHLLIIIIKSRCILSHGPVAHFPSMHRCCDRHATLLLICVTQIHLTFNILFNCRQPKKTCGESFHFHHRHWLSCCHARAITCSGNNLTFPAPYWETKSSAGLVFAVPAFCRSGLTGRVADSVCGEGMSSGRLLGKLASTTRVYRSLLQSLSSARSSCLVHLSFLPSGRGAT